MLDEIVVGERRVSEGVQLAARADRTGALVSQDAHGRYREACRLGRLFNASNQAAQAVSVALTTTYTGLCISNPAGNTKTASLLGCFYALTVAPAGIASLHLIGGYSAAGVVTHTAALAAPGIQSGLLGGLNSTMKADTQATIVNPGYVLPVCSGFTAGALPSTSPGWIDLAGMIELVPGAWIAWGALTAVTGFGGFVWEEIDI